MSSTITFYIVRHGKTMLNTLDRVQGWCDSFLTEEGIGVAEFLGKGMTDIEIESVYTSDLRRTVQTAKIILDKKGQPELPITELEGFREACFGSYESEYNYKMWGDAALYLHYKTLDAMFRALVDHELSHEQTLNAVSELDPSGKAENFAQLEARTQKALSEIAECESRKNKDVNILIVAHGMSIVGMLNNLGGKELLKGHLDNASVSKVIYSNGKFKVETMGDMSYVHKGRTLSHD